MLVRTGAGLLLASLMLASGSYAQAPSLVPHSKNQTPKAPPAPVVAPLGIGTAFNASLNEALDTRRSKAGDPVSAQTSEDVLYERCVILPKGTKVLGHVVRVTSGGRGQAGSAIFVQFDKAILQDGQEVIINAGIQALALGASSASPADADSPRNLDSTPQALPVEDSERSNRSGDALVVSTLYESPRQKLRVPFGAAPAPEGEFSSDGLFAPDSKGAFGRPDLKVYTPTSEGSRGTVLLSAKKSLRIESGTHLLLVVQPPPSGDTDAENPLDIDANQ